MENLTHSLVGLLCAEVAVRVRERRRPLESWSRGALYAIAIAGNNWPDLDFTYSRISGPRFGYLLQHRGYTHTVPAAFGFAVLTLLMLHLLARHRGSAPPRRDWWLFSALALLSPLLHIAMDFANNYGVHPFWPLYNGWFYGDAVFILEPSFWLALSAPLIFSYSSKLARGALGLVVLVALGALWYRPFVPRGNAIVLSVLALGLLLGARRRSPFGRMLLSGASFAFLLGSFVCGSRVAKGLVRERARTAFPTASVLDIVTTPLPANPFCWDVLLVERDQRTYFVRLGRAAIFPAWLDVKACPFDRAASPTAPLTPLPMATDPRLVLTRESRALLEDLRQIQRRRCEASALFRFARVPYLAPNQAGGARVIGDLRYDRKPGLDFSDLRLTENQATRADECPKYVPAWRPPRSDILSNP